MKTLLSLLLLSHSVQAEPLVPPSPDVDALVAQAKDKALGKSREWLRLAAQPATAPGALGRARAPSAPAGAA